MILLLAALYRRTLDRATAGVALLLYAIDESQIEGAAWVAARNTLMTASFVLLTVLAWDRRRSSAQLGWASWNPDTHGFARVTLPAVGSSVWVPGVTKPPVNAPQLRAAFQH